MKIIRPLVAFLVLLAIWEAATRIFGVPAYVLPAPSVIYAATASFGWRFVPHFLATLETILLGFGASMLIAIPLGAAIASWRRFADTVLPLVVFANAVPVVALAPIIVLSLGPGMSARVVVVVLISFFPILVSTITGLRATPTETLELARVAGSPGLKTLFQIELPGAVPYLFNGFRIGVAAAVAGGVVGEFVAADQGLGYLVVHSTTNFDVPRAMAAVTLLAIISVALYQAVELVQRRLFPWSLKGGRA